MLKNTAEIIIIGFAIASIWFYVRSLWSGDLSSRLVYRWIIIMVPLGIFISWGLKVLGII